MARRKQKRSHGAEINVPSLLAGIALGAAIIYLGSSLIRTGRAATGAAAAPMAVSGYRFMQPYAIAGALTTAAGLLPSGQTSTTGVYPPPTGPY